MKLMVKALISLMLIMAVCVGCKKQEEKKAAQPTPANGHSPKKESVVVIPKSVQGKWKAAKIAVTDKDTNKENVYTVAIGSSFTIPGNNLVVYLDNFLPDFKMDGTTLTSQSNTLGNPAAQIRILDNGNEIFKGWLFSRFPTTHAFQHPRYGFTLVDFVPAR
jgi:hypothetical protein